MSIVNFAIPKTLEKRVDHAIQEKGFASKAEFFRSAAIYFIEIIDQPVDLENERFDYLTSAVSQAVINKYKGKSIPSLKKQLAGI